MAFAEPIGHADDVARATRALIDDLCRRLAAAHRGARRLELVLFRTDATVARAAISTSRPVRSLGHLERLFRHPLEGLDPSFGVKVMILAAPAVDPLPPAQDPLVADNGNSPGDEAAAQLVDRLSNRLGSRHVVHLMPRASHLPERACDERPALAESSAGEVVALLGDGRSRRPRPVHLLPWPEPIEVVAPVPDGPPALFRWRRAQHRVAAAEGPERIGPEWWLEDYGHDPERQAQIRDYYRIEDAGGRRFWVFRDGPYRPDRPPRRYLHGLFA